MDLSQVTSMRVLADQMKYNSARQVIIAENIASNEIPGYTRKDINKEGFSSYLSEAGSKLKLSTTSGGHLATINGSPNKLIHDQKIPVELDMESLEMMKNNAQFTQASTTYKKFMSLFKEAIGSSNR
jgi:flagellar basal-body rod protein FlgB